jgi:hypothetical protein
MPQKICIISFDHWDYDHHIVTALQKKGIDSFHIKIGQFKHKNLWARIHNSLSKIFLNKNPKLIKRQEYILETLQLHGIQDQILVLNPELIDLAYHKQIKGYTKKYMAYLYDSMARCSISHLLDGIFDEIYSFDKEDIQNYGFKPTTNYNYIEKIQKSAPSDIKNDVLYIASFDKRISNLFALQTYFDQLKKSYKFIVIGKKTTLYKWKHIFSSQLKKIDLRRNRVNQKEMHTYYKQTQVVIDLVRTNQTGLSFRIFEAMAFEKKVITTNRNVVTYDFYNPNNIRVIDEHNLTIEALFFETSYQSLPDEIYLYYTLSAWVDRIFNLK